MRNLIAAETTDTVNLDFGLIDQIEAESPTAGNFTGFGDFLALGVNVMFGVAAGMTVIGLLLAGIRYAMARSDIKAKQQAKQALTYSIVAFILVFGAYTIYRIIINTLQVHNFGESGGSPGGGGTGPILME